MLKKILVVILKSNQLTEIKKTYKALKNLFKNIFFL
jgi:hypothetical protein